MQNPSPFDSFSGTYNEVHNQYLPAGMTHEQFFVQKLNWVASQLPKSQDFTLLDFGCNQGELMLGLAPQIQAATFYGVDESEASLETARASAKDLSNRLHFSTGLSQVDAKIQFDLITLFNVLHHVRVSERVPLIAELFKRLKTPNSKLLIWEHNRWNPVTRYLVKICPFDEGVVLVKRSELEAALKDAGFTKIQFEYINIFPPKFHRFALIRFFEKLFNKIPLGAQYRMIVQ